MRGVAYSKNILKINNKQQYSKNLLLDMKTIQKLWSSQKVWPIQSLIKKSTAKDAQNKFDWSIKIGLEKQFY